MRCPQCFSEMGRTVGRHQYRESGLDNVWLIDWPLLVCPDCRTKVPILPDAEAAAQVITAHLLRERARLDGDSVVFLRKAMRLKATELAQIMGVDRVTVSRWENDKSPIHPYEDFKLRMEAIDRIIPKGMQRDLRDEVTIMLYRTYSPSQTITDCTINVPPEPEMAAACG